MQREISFYSDRHGKHLSGIWSVFAGRITVTAPDGRQETTHLGSSERRTNRGTAAAEREGAHIKLLDGAAPIVRGAAIKSTASISVTAPRGKPVLRDPPVRTRPGPQWDEGVAWRIPDAAAHTFAGDVPSGLRCERGMIRSLLAKHRDRR